MHCTVYSPFLFVLFCTIDLARNAIEIHELVGNKPSDWNRECISLHVQTVFCQSLNWVL
jgi:hypothetical protein